MVPASDGATNPLVDPATGPVAAFSPWNFRSLLPARKVAPAIAAGCSIVLKPAHEAPRSSFLLAQECADARLPPGIVSVVTGDSARISEHLIRSPIIKKVSLTGLVPVGVLAFDDAEVEPVARQVAIGKFRNAGQVCIAASRFLVHESLSEQFIDHFADTANHMNIGDGREAGINMGPLANQRRVDATEAPIADTIGRGAELRHGGERIMGSAVDSALYPRSCQVSTRTC